jgi:hypothetical protein
MNIGDVVKYGRHFWQWGRVVEVRDDDHPGAYWNNGDDTLTPCTVRVKRRNRIWVARDAVEIVIPQQDWDEGLYDDVLRGEKFVEAR